MIESSRHPVTCMFPLLRPGAVRASLVRERRPGSGPVPGEGPEVHLHRGGEALSSSFTSTSHQLLIPLSYLLSLPSLPFFLFLIPSALFFVLISILIFNPYHSSLSLSLYFILILHLHPLSVSFFLILLL
jgi:hypothetical protein